MSLINPQLCSMKHRKQAHSLGHMSGELQAVTGTAVWAFPLVSPPRPPRFPGSSQSTPRHSVNKWAGAVWKPVRLPNRTRVSAACRVLAAEAGQSRAKGKPSYTGPPVSKTQNQECRLRRQTSYLVNFVFIYFRCIYLIKETFFFPINEITVLVCLHPLR